MCISSAMATPAIEAQVRKSAAAYHISSMSTGTCCRRPEHGDAVLLQWPTCTESPAERCLFHAYSRRLEPFLLNASKLARAAGVPYCICPAGMLDHWSLGQRSWKKKIALMLCYRKMLNEAAFSASAEHR